MIMSNYEKICLRTSKRDTGLKLHANIMEILEWSRNQSAKHRGLSTDYDEKRMEKNRKHKLIHNNKNRNS